MTATVIDVDHVVAIAQDVFTAMIDGEPGLLTVDAPSDELAGGVHAWVDIQGDAPLRSVVSVGSQGADQIARAVMRLAPGEAVEEEDLTDALGEVANVIGGNVKALVTSPGSLTLPQVTIGGSGPLGGQLMWQAPLRWRSHRLVISMWSLENYGKDVTL